MKKLTKQQKVEMKVGKNREDFWFLSVDGVVYAESRFESLVRNLAAKVLELNEGVEFDVIG